MSKIIWKSTILPELSIKPQTLHDESYNDQIENTRAYPVDSRDIVIPDPKSYRSMSRAALFVANLCQEAKSFLDPFLNHSPFSVGVYCACENGPIDAPSTKKILDQNDPSAFATHYRKFRNPKMYLKQLPNLVPAQMGIFMGLQGPMNVYTHCLAGSYHALDQAEWDLKTGSVDAALVCATHAFDDFLVLKRSRAQDLRCLNEGAAAALLVRDKNFNHWNQPETPDPQNFYGIADPLIRILNTKD
jgi:3-oxoacyl-(acyl-carrier-protein) synthase